MKNKSKRLLSSLLATMLVFGLFAAMPLTASAADGAFQVTENPVGAVYSLNAVAVPLRASFEYTPAVGSVGLDSDTPIKVQWYWSNEDSNTGRSNGLGEATIPYDRHITYTTTLVPATDTVGVRYYYAVVSYASSTIISSGQATSKPSETVTEPARIEVIDTRHGFRVNKVDEDGNPLAGAVLALVPDSSYQQDDSVQSHEETTTASGYASFSVTDGYYILSEKLAPAGYNATDEEYYIHVTPNGVYLFDPATKSARMYEPVTFVNKTIPTLNRDDHFAFMQGYPEGTFMPERNMTRAEAVIMFSRLLSESMNVTTDYRNNYYSDVDPAAWYANQVGYMQSLGVLADYSQDGRFRPDDPVTRAEFATLAAHFDNLVLSDTNDFSDVPANHWAVKYINSAAEKGWITGYPDGTFKPEAYITRAEVVTLVGRILDREADSAYLTANAASLPRIYTDLLTTHWAYLAIMEASTGHDYIMDSLGEHWTATYQ